MALVSQPVIETFTTFTCILRENWQSVAEHVSRAENAQRSGASRKKTGGAEQSGEWVLHKNDGAEREAGGCRNTLECGAAFSLLTLCSHALVSGTSCTLSVVSRAENSKQEVLVWNLDPFPPLHPFRFSIRSFPFLVFVSLPCAKVPSSRSSYVAWGALSSPMGRSRARPTKSFWWILS